MGSTRVPRILLSAHEPAPVADVRRLLEEAGHVVEEHGTGSVDPANLSAYDAIVLDGNRREQEALQLCRRWRAGLGDSFIPMLMVIGDQTPATRLACFEAGADTCLHRPFDPGELLAQVQALLRIKERHDRLMEKTMEMHHTYKRLHQAHQRVNQELELARRIQLSFLPQTLPDILGARFAVHYRPCGRVGGDFYDIFRLDEHHIGFYVADAMGHGVPASMLTMYLKKAVRAKEIFQNEYRLVPPEEVLQRLNHDLIEQGLAETSFITMIYGLFNAQEGTLHFARAGHPHPVYIPCGREPELWKAPGSLLGVFETKFTDQVCHLQPGDKMLFYTDGTDQISFEGQPAGTDSLLVCVQRHRDLPIAALVEQLAHDFFRQEEQPDDFTLLGLEVRS
jgi:serine phosphatase RsbU (regulator of sigma subunit)